METLRILLADDHQIVRQGTRALLATVSGWEVIAETDNGRDAVTLSEKLKPDVVILDIGMPELNGLDATQQIKKQSPETEVLIFTGQVTDQLIHDVFASGARSYIVKHDASNQLIDAVKALSEHRTFFTSHVSEVIFSRYMQEEKSRDDTLDKSRISAREREIVQLLAEGKSNKEVADTLGISVKTAETHRAAIMRKLGLKSFSEMVRYAIRNKIIEA